MKIKVNITAKEILRALQHRWYIVLLCLVLVLAGTLVMQRAAWQRENNRLKAQHTEQALIKRQALEKEHADQFAKQLALEAAEAEKLAMQQAQEEAKRVAEEKKNADDLAKQQAQEVKAVDELVKQQTNAANELAKQQTLITTKTDAIAALETELKQTQDDTQKQLAAKEQIKSSILAKQAEIQQLQNEFDHKIIFQLDPLKKKTSTMALKMQPAAQLGVGASRRVIDYYIAKFNDNALMEMLAKSFPDYAEGMNELISISRGEYDMLTVRVIVAGDVPYQKVQEKVFEFLSSMTAEIVTETGTEHQLKIISQGESVSIDYNLNNIRNIALRPVNTATDELGNLERNLATNEQSIVKLEEKHAGLLVKKEDAKIALSEQVVLVEALTADLATLTQTVAVEQQKLATVQATQQPTAQPTPTPTASPTPLPTIPPLPEETFEAVEIVKVPFEWAMSILTGLLLGLIVGLTVVIALHLINIPLLYAEQLQDSLALRYLGSSKGAGDEQAIQVLVANLDDANKGNSKHILLIGDAAGAHRLAQIQQNLQAIYQQQGTELVFSQGAGIRHDAETIRLLSQADAVVLVETEKASSLRHIYKDLVRVQQSNKLVLGYYMV